MSAAKRKFCSAHCFYVFFQKIHKSNHNLHYFARIVQPDAEQEGAPALGVKFSHMVGALRLVEKMLGGK